MANGAYTYSASQQIYDITVTTTGVYDITAYGAQGGGGGSLDTGAAVRLRPGMLDRVRVRRASDQSELSIATACRARIAAARETVTPPGLRLVA